MVAIKPNRVRTHLVVPDTHAHYQYSNERAIWLGKLINDIKPDVVVNLGDMADMPSLSSYDKGKKSFQGRTYQADINVHLDFQDKLWTTVRSAKKRLPERYGLHGNHEERIGRAIEVQPELEGVISYADLNLKDWYDVEVPYDGGTPGVVSVDGINYAHYIISGISGRPISGEHHAHSLLQKTYTSTCVGHSHLFDLCTRTRGDGKKIIGLVAGCYIDYTMAWAGDCNRLWDSGVILLEGVENGVFDIRQISLKRIKKEYAK